MEDRDGNPYVGSNTDAISIASVNSKGVNVNGLARIADSGEGCEEFASEERKRVTYVINRDDGILCPLAVKVTKILDFHSVGMRYATAHSLANWHGCHRTCWCL